MSVSPDDSSRNIPLALAITADGRPKYIIAAEARMPANVLSGVVSGRVAPSDAQRGRLASALGRTEAELFSNDAYAGGAS